MPISLVRRETKDDDYSDGNNDHEE